MGVVFKQGLGTLISDGSESWDTSGGHVAAADWRTALSFGGAVLRERSQQPLL